MILIASDLQAAHLLVMGEAPLLAAHLQRSLHDSGYQVSLGQDGAEGLHLASHGGFDLILQGILLPTLNGLAALQQLRQNSSVAEILMSASGDGPERSAGFSHGAADDLPKPLSMAELRVAAVLCRVACERKERSSRELDLARHQRQRKICSKSSLRPWGRSRTWRRWPSGLRSSH